MDAKPTRREHSSDLRSGPLPEQRRLVTGTDLPPNRTTPCPRRPASGAIGVPAAEAAVIHSFDDAQVAVIEHHFASRQFVTHEMREASAGRPTPAQREQLVPPIGGSTTPVCGRRYEPAVLRPNFFPQPPPWRIAQ
jgi:hypothetical protein